MERSPHNLTPRIGGSPASPSEVRRHEPRCGLVGHDLPLHGVIPHVAAVVAEVTRSLRSRRDDGQPPLSAIDQRLALRNRRRLC